MNRNYGIILSVFIHAIILTIPISIVVKDKKQEIELFILTEEAQSRPAQVIQQRKIVKQVISTEKKKLSPEKIEQIVKPIKMPIPKGDTQEPFVKEKAPMEEPTKQSEINMPTEIKVQSSVGANIIKETEKPIETEFGSSIAPVFLHRVMPEYPLIAKKLGKEGKVILRLTIDKSGNLVDIEVIKKADYGFTEAAIEAVKKSTFLPAKKDGKPVASKAILPISFILRR